MSIKDDWSRTVGRRVKKKYYEVYGHISKMPITSHDDDSLIVVFLDSGGIYWADKSDWAPVDIPSPDAWNGEGLPPVGAVCEHKRVHEWQKVEVFAVKPNYNGSETALFTYENGTWGGCAEPSFFRPIRPPEQIAAEEREAAIREMVILAEADRTSLVGAACAALYDAGYRKQKDN